MRKVFEISEKKQPRALLGVVQVTGAYGIFMKNIVDIFKFFQTRLPISWGFSQTSRLNEDTALLLVFELLMEMTTSVSRWNIEAEEYIECIGWLDPDAA